MNAAGVLLAFDGVVVHDGWKLFQHHDRNPTTGKGLYATERG